MALEAVVYPQNSFIYCPNYNTNTLLRSDYGDGYPFGPILTEEEVDPHDDKVAIYANNSSVGTGSNCWPDVHHNKSSSPETMVAAVGGDQEQLQTAAGGGRRKRRHMKSTKNREEIENQRMTHITVERNRRKQMNEYLAVLRSLMPPSYSQRGDQASIIGGAINFVKELEQLLQSIEAQKFTNDHSHNDIEDDNRLMQPFSDFFSFPQYSTTRAISSEPSTTRDASADIEVTMVESHANLKIQSRRQPRQLLKLVAGLQSIRLSVLHMNVTSSGDMVMYSVSVKVEEGSHLTTVDEIAAAVNQMFHRIEEEASFS